MTVKVITKNARRVGSASRKQMRCEKIIETARALYTEKGIEHTSVSDITEALGITRTLFYHYFSNKDEVTKAILQGYVRDVVERTDQWHKSLTPDMTMDEYVDSLVSLLHTQLNEMEGFKQDLLKKQNAVLYQHYFLQACSAVAHYFVDINSKLGSIATSRVYQHPYETFYTVLVGMVAVIRHNPNIPDETLRDIIITTLHLPMDQKIGARI